MPKLRGRRRCASWTPRVTTVLNRIQASDDLRISLATAAEMAFWYMLWRKLTRAMLAIGSERTISDAVHLTRTIYQMFGMPPSVLMRGTLAEISSPFEAPGQAASRS